MSHEKVLKEIVFKRLEKETFIKFSDKSREIIEGSLDEHIEGKSLDEVLSKFSSVESTTSKIVKRAISLYKEENSRPA